MPEIDDDQLEILFSKAAKEAALSKERFQDCVTLCNQIRGIQKTAKGDLPVSRLTKKPLKETTRKVIHEEVIEAATRLKLL